MDEITDTYCRIADFYKAAEPQLKARLLTDGKRHRSRKGSLSICYVPPYSGFFVPSYFGVRQAESPTLPPGGLAPTTGWDKRPIGIGER